MQIHVVGPTAVKILAGATLVGSMSALISACGSSTPAASPSSPATTTAVTPSRSQSPTTANPDAIAVSILASEKSCTVNPVRVPAGPLTFTTSNVGDAVNGFVLSQSGGSKAVLGESRNLPSGGTGEFSADLKAGTYATACLPGNGGPAFAGTFTVTKD